MAIDDGRNNMSKFTTALPLAVLDAFRLTIIHGLWTPADARGDAALASLASSESRATRDPPFDEPRLFETPLADRSRITPLIGPCALLAPPPQDQW